MGGGERQKRTTIYTGIERDGEKNTPRERGRREEGLLLGGEREGEGERAIFFSSRRSFSVSLSFSLMSRPIAVEIKEEGKRQQRGGKKVEPKERWKRPSREAKSECDTHTCTVCTEREMEKNPPLSTWRGRRRRGKPCYAAAVWHRRNEEVGGESDRGKGRTTRG